MGLLPGRVTVDLDSRAYEFIPQGHPLSDPRKEQITIGQLLSMSAGIPGSGCGVMGMATTSDAGPFEFALGRCPNRHGKWVDKLFGDPGTVWNYSDASYVHLALAFRHITGREMSDYLSERLFRPAGIETASWDIQGGGGFIGPHTNAHTGLHISARELARFGYLVLRRGAWEDAQLIPEWWIDLAAAPSQDLNPTYGYSWRTNRSGTAWPGLPIDMFSVNPGYRANTCHIIPSLDLVVVRVGTGPSVWDEIGFVRSVVGAIVND